MKGVTDNLSLKESRERKYEGHFQDLRQGRVIISGLTDLGGYSYSKVVTVPIISFVRASFFFVFCKSIPAGIISHVIYVNVNLS